MAASGASLHASSVHRSIQGTCPATSPSELSLNHTSVMRTGAAADGAGAGTACVPPWPPLRPLLLSRCCCRRRAIGGRQAGFRAGGTLDLDLRREITHRERARGTLYEAGRAGHGRVGEESAGSGAHGKRGGAWPEGGARRGRRPPGRPPPGLPPLRKWWRRQAQSAAVPSAWQWRGGSSAGWARERRGGAAGRQAVGQAAHARRLEYTGRTRGAGCDRRERVQGRRGAAAMGRAAPAPWRVGGNVEARIGGRSERSFRRISRRGGRPQRAQRFSAAARRRAPRAPGACG